MEEFDFTDEQKQRKQEFVSVILGMYREAGFDISDHDLRDFADEWACLSVEDGSTEAKMREELKKIIEMDKRCRLHEIVNAELPDWESRREEIQSLVDNALSKGLGFDDFKTEVKKLK